MATEHEPSYAAEEMAAEIDFLRNRIRGYQLELVAKGKLLQLRDEQFVQLAGLKSLIRDLLGDGDSCFPPRGPGDGLYWWRRWLRSRYEALVPRRIFGEEPR